MIISIIGPPAIGKTSLCKRISETFNCTMLDESIDDMTQELRQNIRDHKHFLQTELWFHDQMTRNMERANEISINGGNVIMDTHWEILYVWKNVVLESKLDIDVFEKLLNFTEKYIRKPDLVIGLTASDEHILKYSVERNADYDDSEKSRNRIIFLRDEYCKFYENRDITVIDTTGLDFIRNPEDWECIMSTTGLGNLLIGEG